jgi:carbonic anhydrase
MPDDPPEDLLGELLAANERYARHAHPTGLTGRAARGVAVLTCIDTRIDPLAVLGLVPGDAKILRNAGARVTDDALRSLVLAANLLDVETILLMQHTDCAMTSRTDDELRELLGARHGVDAAAWDFLTIADQDAVLRADAARIDACPLIDDDVRVVLSVYDVESGRVHVVDREPARE